MTAEYSDIETIQRGTDETISVVHLDDDPLFPELSVEFLEQEDDRISVHPETDQQAALEYVEQENCDCIVSDYDMPEQNGLEFLETVRKQFPDLPFILFTGKGSEQVASKAISAGVSDYLQKQSSPEQFELLANRIVNHAERTRALRALAGRESHLRQAQTVANLGSWYKDITADDIHWSDEVYEIFDIAESERPIDHEQFLTYVHPEDSEYVNRAWNAALEGDEYDIEHRIVTGDDETRWVRERAAVRFDDDGSASSALGIVQDITERKHREERIRQTTARLEALFENSPDMITVHDGEGTIVDTNSRICAKTGYDEAELIGMKVWEIDRELTPDEARSIWDGMEVGDRHRVESEYLCKDGSTFPVEVHLRRTKLDGADQFLVISRDISEREAQTQQLRRQNSQLKRFTDVLAHDIPNHLNVAELHVERARETDDRLQHLDQIEITHERIATLVDEMQTLVRAGEPVQETVWIRLSTVANSCWGSCCLEENPATLSITRDGLVQANEHRFMQLFENLFWNACDHAGEDVTVHVGVTENGFYVADDGPGIPDEERADVLDPGYTTGDDAHMGFGLAIVRGIVDAHGWDLHVTESEDGGARFEVTGADVKDG